jgi:translocator protein
MDLVLEWLQHWWTDGWTPAEITAVSIGIFVAAAGGIATEVGPWYKSLKNPSWKPPDWAFGPIWTIIITLAVFAGEYGWRIAPDRTSQLTLLIVFVANGVFNIAWSAIFFKMKRPDWALIEAGFLWTSVLAMIIVCYPFSKISSLLLLPYLLWVSVASLLNRAVIRLNGPFTDLAKH